MRRSWACLCLALAGAFGGLVEAGRAATPPSGPAPAPVGLQVDGDDLAWQAENDFGVHWESPPPGPRGPVIAAHYLVRGPNGGVVGGPTRTTASLNSVHGIEVPATPGVYTAEVWLEDAHGRGPSATVPLRFDDRRPAAPRAQAAAAWFGSGVPAALTLDPAREPPPISGIRGYAVALDDGAAAPCTAPAQCLAAALAPQTGAAGPTIQLGLLHEGVHSVRVATVSGSGVASTATTAPVRVDTTPPLTRLAGPTDGWTNGPVAVTALAADALSGMAPTGPFPPYTAIAVDGGAAQLSEGATVTTTVHGEGVHTVTHFARDAAGNIADGEGGAPTAATARLRIDETPPRVAFAAASDPAEPGRVEATVGDALSGADPARGSIGVRPEDSALRFEPLATRLIDGRLVARWNAAEQPPGRYEFQVTGYDLAGNAASSTRRYGGREMVLSNPPKREAVLELRLLRPLATHAIAAERTAEIGGVLREAGGGALAGERVEIVETFAPGATPPIRTSSLRSGPDGGFRLRLAAGPSRSVTARFAGSPTATKAESPSLRLEVATAVRLRVSSPRAVIGGRPIVFTGTLPAAATASAPGRSVELQFRVGGLPWREFRTVQADRAGRFRYRYRFADDDSRGARFRFRAFVPSQPNWPYKPGVSKPVVVTGR